jgi:SAM-dependent methyltransferase
MVAGAGLSRVSTAAAARLRSLTIPQAVSAESEAEVRQVVGLLGLPPGATVLELPCGIGRYTVPLARSGLRVTGVDENPVYVRLTAQAATREGLDLNLRVGDPRTVRTSIAFQAVLSLGSAFGSYDDQADDARFVQTAHHALADDGILVIDTLGKEVVAQITRERGWHREDGALFYSDWRVSRGYGWVEHRLIVFRDGEQIELTAGFRPYTAMELSDLLRSAGFGDVQVYGDLAGGVYDQFAVRLVAVARKRG